ncbi:unnamed protein product [Absidia cylindrospora]
MPFMINIFEKDVKFIGKQGESYVGRNGDDLDNGVPSMMTDYTVFYRTRLSQEFGLFGVEVKPPGKSSSGQLQSDTLKLAKEMKRMVDFLVDSGVDSVIVGGMLVEGASCSTYIMDLNFDGVYRMIQLDDGEEDEY